MALVAGPGLPDVDPADDEQLRVELAAPTVYRSNIELRNLSWD